MRPDGSDVNGVSFSFVTFVRYTSFKHKQGPLNANTLSYDFEYDFVAEMKEQNIDRTHERQS